MRHIPLYVCLLIATAICLESCNKNKVNHTSLPQQSPYPVFLAEIKLATDTIETEYLKTVFVRKKVAEWIKVGLGTRAVNRIDSNWQKWSAERYYNFFYADSGTVDCGGAALFLSRVFADLKYTSFTYNMGCPDVYTHEVTLVQLPDSNYYVQDAFLNLGYGLKRDSSALPFIDLLMLLKERKDQEIWVKNEPLNTRQVWDTTGLASLQLTNKYVASLVDSIEKTYHSGSVPDRYMVANVSYAVRHTYERCLQKHQLPDNRLYLFLLPLSSADQSFMNRISPPVSKHFYE